MTRRYEFVRVHRREWPVSWICSVMRVSVSGFHAWSRRGISAKRISDHRLSVLIREAHERAHRRYGYRRIHQVLVRNGLAIGRNAVARVMRHEKIRPWYHRKWRKSPMDSPECQAAPNRLNRKFEPGEPDRAWLADMTEVRTPDGKLYLATVEDIGSRRIVGHAMANRMTAELPLRALRKALSAREVPIRLLAHSDQGSQFRSRLYQGELRRHGIRCSMSRRANGHDNSPMESFYSSLKRELDLRSCTTREQVELEIFQFIEIDYNRKRLHSTLGYMTPEEYEMARMKSRNTKTKPEIKKPPLKIKYQRPVKPAHARQP